MRIPVFVSCPSVLNATQQASRNLILGELEACGLDARTLGRSDYPTEAPLREVLVLAKHCSGGVILGYSQMEVASATVKAGTNQEQRVEGSAMPTPWNHLEAGILYSLRLPLLVFREQGISGGIFDPEVSGLFVHVMPDAALLNARGPEVREIVLKWQAQVRERYYNL